MNAGAACVTGGAPAFTAQTPEQAALGGNDKERGVGVEVEVGGRCGDEGGVKREAGGGWRGGEEGLRDGSTGSTTNTDHRNCL